MIVSKNNLFVKLSSFARYGTFFLPKNKEGPKSLCNLFWSGILGIINLILFPGQIARKLVEGKFSPFWENCFVNLFLLLISILVATCSTIYSENPVWYHYIFGFLSMIFTIGLIIGGVLLGEFLYNEYKARKANKVADPNYKPSIVKSFFKASKKRVCPLIDYTD